MTDAQRKRLLSLATSTPNLPAYLQAALSATLPACEPRYHLPLERLGHWIYPMILVASWTAEGITDEEAFLRSAALRTEWQEWFEGVRSSAAASTSYQLTGEKKKATADLLASLGDLRL